MEVHEIHVGMADMKVARSPAILTSLGIGSCVGIVLYYPRLKIGGMAHIMLPDIEVVRNKSNRAKFANTAVPDLLREMEQMGAEKLMIKAKIMGGAHMFCFAKSSTVFNIGERNVEKVKQILQELRIKIVAEDTGGCYGRSLFFDLDTGLVRVRTIAHGEKIL
ncbi:MAG: chemotaxis protein CheD [Candidatus Omnitrophica bacterium]|nr:chemotaxis protein CheD [Candidatus Omnitrophota bacterium]MBU4479499.1 chemotaxis protein CheD [Candidatus Omnitrophota bacterium]MCG2702992.1 chemotaxis protein CheD [Candidatus Omnitrophota bacterium]